MLNVFNLLNNVDIQCAVNFCYYDCEKNERVILTEYEACVYEIKNMYCEKDEIYIEVEMENRNVRL